MLEIKNVTFSFGKERVIDNLSLTLEKGKAYCIMGASGVGKTTLLRVLSGLLKPQSGKVLHDESLTKTFIFQENRLLPHLSIYDNIKFVTDDEKKIAEALRSTSLFAEKDKSADELSGGMARRAAIARAAAHDGDVFFIDEPLYGLDVKTSEEILSLIKSTISEKTAVIITHSPDEAFYLADEIIFLKEKPVSEAVIIEKCKFNDAESIKSYLLA